METNHRRFKIGRCDRRFWIDIVVDVRAAIADAISVRLEIASSQHRDLESAIVDL
ncbi:MAG TPA: hypothetical protein VK989_08645 [Polyangia bacterium]|nr:hypothetical protein [Polyangia bacterium]